MGDEHILRLPLGVISPVDVGRVSRELAALDEFLRQAVLREPDKSPALPRTSKLLEELAANNNLDLLDEKKRRHLLEFVYNLKNNAPVLHISFAVDPSPTFLQKLMNWLRQEIHPLVLVQLGLQPSIAVGCVLRTPDKYFDFSLRRHLLDKRGLLIEQIGGGAKE